MEFNPTILRTYASTDKPESLPKNVYFSHSPYTVTIYDLYPKAIFHFLVLPRILKSANKASSHEDYKGEATVKGGDSGRMSLLASLTADELRSLNNLLNVPSIKWRSVHALLLQLKEDAEQVLSRVQDDMRKNYGFVWDVYMGFHAVQSMDHIHLHVISSDFCSPRLKTKKHYNSFHPKLGFFLHLDQVLSWFEVDESGNPRLRKKMEKASAFLQKLKEPLMCHHCGREQKNMPQLKAHLQGHFDDLKNAAQKKRTRVTVELNEASKSGTTQEKELECEGSTSGKNETEDSKESEELPKKKRKEVH